MKVKVLSIVALVVVLLSSCSKADYVNVVPADASFVASFNMKDIADDADLKNSGLVDMLNKSLGFVVSGKEKDKVQEYINDPRSMGIDFGEPVYMFKTANECIGLAMKVGSESDLKEFLQLLAKQSICSKPQERDDYICGTLLDDIEYTFDGKTLLLLSCLGDGGSAMNKSMSAQLMKQGADHSFASTEAFDKMDGQKGALKMYCNIGVLPEDVSKQFIHFLPKGVKKSDIELLATLSFDDGTATFTSIMWGNTPKAQQFMEETNKNLRKLDGEFIKAPTEDFLAWVSVGVYGEWLLKNLKEDKDLKTMLLAVERGIDIEQMLRSVEGDFTVVLPMSAITREKGLDFVAMAELKNSKFLDDVDYWKESMKDYGISMRNVSGNDYLLNFEDGTSVNWGVSADKEVLYFAPSTAFNHHNISPKSELLEAYEDEIEESQVFMFFNLKNAPLREIGMTIGMPYLSDALGKLQSLIIKSSSAEQMQIVIELEKKDENFLKQILN